MLPPNPPKLSRTDFDPSEIDNEQYADVEMELDEIESKVELSSVEINILIYLYLLESNFPHSAFTLLSESNLQTTSLFQHFHPSHPSSSNARKATTPTTENGFGKADGRIPRGELVRKLWKALRWEEIERHVTANGEIYRPACPNAFHLLIPHACPSSYPSASGNPAQPLNLRSSPAPARRPEAFPPVPNEPVPSRSSREDSRSRKKGRRLSAASDLHQPSPLARSPTPSSASKEREPRRERDRKRPRASEVEDLSERGSKRGSKKKKDSTPSSTSRLSVGADKRDREKSPLKKAEIKEDVEDDKEDEEEAEEDEAKEQEREELERKERETAKRVGKPWYLKDEDITLLSEHRDAVTGVAYNPKNSSVLATASNDGTARLWDVTVGANGLDPDEIQKPTLLSHKSVESNKKAVTAIDWHPDGTILATGCLDGTGRIFTPSGQIQGIMSYGRGSITALKFSPNGSQILVAKMDATVSLWKVGNSYNQTMMRNFSAHTQHVNDIDWLDDHVFASGGNDHKIFVQRANDTQSRYTFSGHTDDVTRIKWAPAKQIDGHQQPGEERLLASASDDGTIRLWKMPRYPKDRGTSSRSLSPKKREASEAGDGEQDGEDDDTLDFLDDGKKGRKHCVRVLKVIEDGESDNKRLSTLEWSPDGKLIAAGGMDTTIKLFDAETGECLHALKGLEEGTGSLAFSSIGNFIAGGGWNGKLMIWSLDGGRIVGEYEFEDDSGKQGSKHKAMMLAMQWRQDKEYLAVALQNKQVMVVKTADLK